MAVPESALSVKRLGNLPGVEVDVVTLRPFRAWMGDDHSLDEYVEEHFGTITRLDAGLLGRLPLGRLGPLVDAPDAFRLFNSRLRGVANAKLVAHYDAVVTWGQWHSVHLVGRAISRLGGQPWVAHFSDPWMENPYVHWGRLASWRNAALERSVMQEALLVTVTSKQTERLLRRRHADLPPERIAVLPHAYDPSLYPAESRPRDHRILLRHLGAFYGPRTPEPLFRGLARLVRDNPDLAHELRVELIGSLPAHMLKGTFRQLPDDLVYVIPPVSYAHSLALMSEADLLLVVDAPASESMFLPSKLVDYLGARRPIVALTPPGASAQLIDQVGGYRADPTDEVAVAGALADAIHAARHHEYSVPEQVLHRYRADFVGRELLEACDRALRASR